MSKRIIFVFIIAITLASCTSRIPEHYRVKPTMLECATMLYQEIQSLELDKFKKDLTTHFQLSENEANTVIAQLKDVKSIRDAERFTFKYRSICNAADMALISLIATWVVGSRGTSGSASGSLSGGSTPSIMPPAGQGRFIF